MIIFDSHYNKFCKTHLVKEKKEREYILEKNSELTIRKLCSGSIKIAVFGKNIFGDGRFNLSISTSHGSKVFHGRFSSKSESSCFFNINIGDFNDFKNIKLEKKPTSIGKLAIKRVIIEKVKSAGKIFEFIKPKKKIAFVVPYGIYGGGEIYLKSLLSDNKFEDCSIDILYLKENALKRRLFFKNIRHKDIKLNNLKNYIIKEKYNTVIFYNSFSVYNTLKRAQIEHRFRLIEIYHSDFKWSDAISNVNEHEVDRVIKISEDVGLHILNKDIKICRVPIDLNRFRPRNKEASLKKLMIRTKNNICALSRLSKEKNIDYLLKIANVMKSFNFYIIGDGPAKDSIIKQIKALNIKNVKLLGWIDRPEEILSAFDAMILASKEEGTPISILEALSMNIPVISYVSGGISSMQKEGLIHPLSLRVEDDVSLIRSVLRKESTVFTKKGRQYIEDNHNILKIKNSFKVNILEFKTISFRQIRANERKIGGFYA